MQGRGIQYNIYNKNDKIPICPPEGNIRRAERERFFAWLMMCFPVRTVVFHVWNGQIVKKVLRIVQKPGRERGIFVYIP